MIRSAGITLAASLLLTLVAAPGAHAVVGGQDADIQDFPSTLNLQYHGAHICGATLIGPGWAVTSAHCVYGGLASSSFSVVAGVSHLSESGGQRLRVSAIFEAPLFSMKTLDYDIALIRLDGDVSGLRPAHLPAVGAAVPAGTITDIVGWGATREGGSASDQLQYAQVPVVDHTACNNASDGQLTDRMLCAGLPQGGVDACLWDSGGPLYQGTTLVGITSWGYGCATPGHPGIYSDVAQFRTWIDTTIADANRLLRAVQNEHGNGTRYKHGG